VIDRFSWRSYDLQTILPRGWQEQFLATSERAVEKVLKGRSVTSREDDPDHSIKVRTVSGTVLKGALPWLEVLYRSLFRDLAQLGSHEPVSCASNDLYGINLNVQKGPSMRYECHVDSNPIEGLLYVTDHVKGTGGELVVANNPAARSVAEVEADASIVYPVAGNLIFFDARRFAHYTRPLLQDNAVRVVAAMNFYVPSCSEQDRPADLNQHLFG
jgi:hypothetical protein